MHALLLHVALSACVCCVCTPHAHIVLVVRRVAFHPERHEARAELAQAGLSSDLMRAEVAEAQTDA